MHCLVWLRRDLRLSDNPALHAAWMDTKKLSSGRLSVLYIDCPQQWKRHGYSDSQLDFIQRNLDTLSQDLSALGVTLHRLQADTFDQVPELLEAWCQANEITAIYANREREIYEQQRDRAVQAAISVPFHLSSADCVIEPGQLLSGSGQMYKVFTPFSKAWLSELQLGGFRLLPSPTQVSAQDTHREWPAGEQAALSRLNAFCQSGLLDYGDERDIPAIDGTSRLSAYLAIGVLSPNQCLAAIQSALGYLPLSRGEQGFTWLNELIWREFYRHLLVAYPRLCKHRAFKPETEALAWNDSEEVFRCWCEGQTGFPLVDAAMRCLNQTHWMHNRLRMVVACFLTKDLHVDWRRGEAYFMRMLIDGDLASNNGGWQWSASTGADAAPYFRMFNPTSQSEKYDPDGSFIRIWIPELADVPPSAIHAPRSWLDQHDAANPYPAPIVDHKAAREQTLAMFKQLKT